MCYPCSENKGADQLRAYRETDLRLYFRIGVISKIMHPFFRTDLQQIYKDFQMIV